MYCNFLIIILPGAGSDRSSILEPFNLHGAVRCRGHLHNKQIKTLLQECCKFYNLKKKKKIEFGIH